MAYRVVENRIQRLGFCCAYSYFSACKNMSTPEIGAELAIHKRTARYWRARYRSGEMTCEGLKSCFFKAQTLPPRYPDSAPVLEPDLDLVPDAAPSEHPV